MPKELDIVIRPLEPDDYIDIAILYNGPLVVSGSLQLPWTPQDVWRRRTEVAELDYPRLVAAIEGMIVGIIEVELGEDRRRHSGKISMAVRDDYQGRGVGSALLESMLELCESWLGLTRIETIVFTDNGPALNLYKRFDFVVEGTFRKYAIRNGKLDDAYTLARINSSPDI